MAAPKGNDFWILRKTDGRSKTFSPSELEAKANEYFNWCVKNPLQEAVLHQRTMKLVNVPKMRAMTEMGFCVFLGISTSSFYKYYVGDNDYVDIITRIREVIRTQKFEGAAAGFLNANIIARDLGLKEQHDHTTDGDKINPPAIVFMDFSEPQDDDGDE